MPAAASTLASASPARAGTQARITDQCYRWDPSGRLDVVVTEDQIHDPNGLCFSPDHKKLYVISRRAKARAIQCPGGDGKVYAFDIGPDFKATNKRLFTDCMVDGIRCGPDGMRCDVNGNVWISSNAGRNLGYSGVTVWTPRANCSGAFAFQRSCGNICFGGPKRNRLFMAASKSIYAVYTATQGAGPG